MSLLLRVLDQRRLILAAVLLLSLLGLAAWYDMNRQEDPFFPYRYGHVSVTWPGAEPLQVERLILNPLEEALAGVEEVSELRGTARLGIAHIVVGMHQHVYDTDAAWQQIRHAVERASRQFPEDAGPAEIADRQMDTAGIVLAVTGSDDLLELREGARRLRRDLFRIRDIARIELIADPGEQVSIFWDDQARLITGLDVAEAGAQLAAANRTLPGGALAVSGRNLILKPPGEVLTLDALADTALRTRDGRVFRLGDIAGIVHEPARPARERMRFDGQPAVGLGIVIPENRVNAVRFGELVRELVAELGPAYAPLEIQEMFYQPYWVDNRLRELGRSLLLGVGILAVLLFASMGFRLGLAVAAIVPVVTLSALAIYAVGGGVLHQMAVAGMVIALGMLVDNAIVMVENVQWHLDRGRSPRQAALTAVRELAMPLAAATGTTVAAFMPLLLSAGDTADFTRAIPVMVILTLLISYAYAIFVSPALAGGLLKPARAARGARLTRVGERLGVLAVARPWSVVLAALVLMAAAMSMARWLDMDFFPDTDRNQLLVDLYFPEGTHVERTALLASQFADDLRQHPAVWRVHEFAGSSGPRFYYNLMETPGTPHLARLVAETGGAGDLSDLMHWVRAYGAHNLPEAQVVSRRLGQGPPVEAPIEIQIFSEHPADLAGAATAVAEVLNRTPGTRDVRHTLGEGLPILRLQADDVRAAALGVTREAIALALAARVEGTVVSFWRAGRDPAPIRLRSAAGQQLSSAALEGLLVPSAGGAAVPLGEVATWHMEWQPAVIRHWDMRRMTTVLAELEPGQTYGQILQRAAPELDRIPLPPGTRLRQAGAAAEAGQANNALFQALPLGVLLLLGCLLLQFNSFRQVGIVLVTIPLALIGVIPGLIITGQPFGFTALLGVVALVGIVVNNAIVLMDVINSERRAGRDRDTAIRAATGRRIRPVLLTTATTVAGLLPLTFTQSTLWPPLAWAIISGLLAATLLTLLVIPALCRLVLPATLPDPA